MQEKSFVSLKTVALFTKAVSLRKFHVFGETRKRFWAVSSIQPDQTANQMSTDRTATVGDLGISRVLHLLAINALIVGILMSNNNVSSAMQ